MCRAKIAASFADAVLFAQRQVAARDLAENHRGHTTECAGAHFQRNAWCGAERWAVPEDLFHRDPRRD